MKDVAGGCGHGLLSSLPVTRLRSQVRLYLAFSLYRQETFRYHRGEIDILAFISSHTAATHSIVFRKFNKNSLSGAHERYLDVEGALE